MVASAAIDNAEKEAAAAAAALKKSAARLKACNSSLTTPSLPRISPTPGTPVVTSMKQSMEKMTDELGPLPRLSGERSPTLPPKFPLWHHLSDNLSLPKPPPAKQRHTFVIAGSLVLALIVVVQACVGSSVIRAPGVLLTVCAAHTGWDQPSDRQGFAHAS